MRDRYCLATDTSVWRETGLTLSLQTA